MQLRVAINADPVTAFPLIADFASYPSLADDVRAVHTTPPAVLGAPRTSDWVMNFRRGIMRWTELEAVDEDRLRIDFEQTDGDFEDFRGSWRVGKATDGAAGSEVLFEVTYDFGIESLVGIMDPIAERVITRAVCAVLSGLFDHVLVLEGAEALTDLAWPIPGHATANATGGN
jgi:ribosome-associated toxin RatA of RatAB toxin-antitoxin module